MGKASGALHAKPQKHASLSCHKRIEVLKEWKFSWFGCCNHGNHGSKYMTYACDWLTRCKRELSKMIQRYPTVKLCLWSGPLRQILQMCLRWKRTQGLFIEAIHKDPIRKHHKMYIYIYILYTYIYIVIYTYITRYIPKNLKECVLF